MKKIIIFISSASIIALLVLVIFFINQPEVEKEYYSVLKNSCYITKEDASLGIDVYSTDNNSRIEFKNSNNYYLSYEGGSATLEVENVSKTSVSSYTLYHIEASLPTPYEAFYNTDICLNIVNESFQLKLDIGKLTLFDPADYELLAVNSLYGSFSYINGELLLTGINIEFAKSFKKLFSVKVGANIHGDLNHILYDANMDYKIEIDKIIPDYKFYYSPTYQSVELSSKNLFIPLQYESINLTTDAYILFNLDGKNYYLDNFTYYSTTIDPKDYSSLTTKGELIYA